MLMVSLDPVSASKWCQHLKYMKIIFGTGNNKTVQSHIKRKRKNEWYWRYKSVEWSTKSDWYLLQKVQSNWEMGKNIKWVCVGVYLSQENRQGLSIRFFCQFTCKQRGTAPTDRCVISLLVAFFMALNRNSENLEELHFSVPKKGAGYYPCRAVICVFIFNIVSTLKKKNQGYLQILTIPIEIPGKECSQTKKRVLNAKKENFDQSREGNTGGKQGQALIAGEAEEYQQGKSLLRGGWT